MSLLHWFPHPLLSCYTEGRPELGLRLAPEVRQGARKGEQRSFSHFLSAYAQAKTIAKGRGHFLRDPCSFSEEDS